MDKTSAFTILLVDDDQAFLEAMEAAIKVKKLNVVTAKSGNDALAQLEKRKITLGAPMIDVIVTDWVMEDGNGLELLARVRRGYKIPVLLISGQVTQEELMSAVELGPDGVLLKPFTVDALLKKIHEVVQHFRSAHPKK